MKVYRCCIYGQGQVDESDKEPVYFAGSLKEARDYAKRLLGETYDPGDTSYVDIESLEVITKGRGWLLNVLNHWRFVRAASTKQIERWMWLDDGRGNAPRKAATRVPQV